MCKRKQQQQTLDTQSKPYSLIVKSETVTEVTK